MAGVVRRGQGDEDLQTGLKRGHSLPADQGHVVDGFQQLVTPAHPRGLPCRQKQQGQGWRRHQGMMRVYLVPSMLAPRRRPDWPKTTAITGESEVVVSATSISPALIMA